MKELEYSLGFLREKLKDCPYEVWSLNYFKNYHYLIDSSTDENSPPPPLAPHPNEEEIIQKTIKEEGKVNIYYFYPEGNQVILCLDSPSVPLAEEDMQHLYYFFYLYKTKETIERKENELYNLVNSFHSITSSLDIDVVLEKIIRNALKVIPAAEAGLLFLYDEKDKLLTPRAPLGFNDSIYNVRFKVGESITGKVFEDGGGRIFNSKEKVYEEMAKYNISPENFDYITAGKSPEAAMCVPISLDDRRIGVMIIHQWVQRKVFVNHDLQLLQGFAEQAAIAIQNAEYYKEANKRLEEVTELSNQLQEKNLELQNRHEVHQALIQISLQNKGVEKIVQELNRMIGPSLSFFNSLENKYYSSRRRPPLFSFFEMKMIFLRKRNPLHVCVYDGSSICYFLYPIFNGSAFLGCFIIDTDEPLLKADRMTLEQGVSVLTLELINKQSLTEIFYKKNHEQFQNLLDYKDNENLILQANELGINPAAHCFIGVFEVPVYTDLQQLEIEIHQLVSKIKKELMLSESLIYGFHNKVILLVSSIRPEDLTQSQTTIRYIRQEYQTMDNSLFRGGFSRTYKGIENIKKCYDEANKTLAYLTERNKSDIICYEDIGLNRLFINQSPQEIEQFVHDVLSPLQADNDRNKDLEETLLTYIEYNRSAGKTAAELHIHINTLYQRLKRIEEILQVDFQKKEDILKVQLACHLKATYEQ
ncbi:helix-turn-helix domain-containing protein [Evansella sp. LMS18]|jgi:sugar diacid utilization regulator|uniref:helix-turn-helix domain-containing protein n=1 Tax=Evansella sp. LMS18 TaxID=2924033 RepID=UPI0020CFEC16|nr:helix-turn-helix domain-containing protein [Evansella sp. LMS18]UTR08766.1 helix-turn-helix domain-containing protein [Evansella sp. LMS18]